MNYSELLQLAKSWGNFISDRIIIWRLPYKLKFIFKTGYEKDEVASSQPFSFANSCSNGNNDCGIISLQGDNDTCGNGMFIVQTS